LLTPPSPAAIQIKYARLEEIASSPRSSSSQ
jgi:hypothetical protein